MVLIAKLRREPPASVAVPLQLLTEGVCNKNTYSSLLSFTLAKRILLFVNLPIHRS